MFAERIFTPLGLTQTSLPVRRDATIPDPHPQGYSFGTKNSTRKTYALPPTTGRGSGPHAEAEQRDGREPLLDVGRGGAISTVPDLFTDVEALVSGRLLDPATQKARADGEHPSHRPAHPTPPATASASRSWARCSGTTARYPAS